MNKAVMISISPKWCELIASGKKTVEVRKTRPTIDTPFRVYIYCTKPKGKNDFGLCLDKGTSGNLKNVGLVYKSNYETAKKMNMQILSGKVIGEFVCDRITKYPYEPYNDGEHYMPFGELENTCLDGIQIYDYLKTRDGYGWHISDLVIYDEPKELGEFKRINRDCQYAHLGLAKRDCPECQNKDCFFQRPPQSWCYVEELQEKGEEIMSDYAKKAHHLLGDDNKFITDDYYSLYGNTHELALNHPMCIGSGYLWRFRSDGLASATLGELHIFPFTSKDGAKNE